MTTKQPPDRRGFERRAHQLRRESEEAWAAQWADQPRRVVQARGHIIGGAMILRRLNAFENDVYFRETALSECWRVLNSAESSILKIVSTSGPGERSRVNDIWPTLNILRDSLFCLSRK